MSHFATYRHAVRVFVFPILIVWWSMLVGMFPTWTNAASRVLPQATLLLHHVSVISPVMHKYCVPEKRQSHVFTASVVIRRAGIPDGVWKLIVPRHPLYK